MQIIGGDKETRKSTTGLFMMGNGPASWYSKLQRCVAVSTVESEYYGIDAANGTKIYFMNSELIINVL